MYTSASDMCHVGQSPCVYTLQDKQRTSVKGERSGLCAYGVRACAASEAATWCVITWTITPGPQVKTGRITVRERMNAGVGHTY